MTKPKDWGEISYSFASTLTIVMVGTVASGGLRHRFIISDASGY